MNSLGTITGDKNIKLSIKSRPSKIMNHPPQEADPSNLPTSLSGQLEFRLNSFSPQTTSQQPRINLGCNYDELVEANVPDKICN